MMKWAEILEENRGEIAALDTIECGKLYHFSKEVEVSIATAALKYYAGAADKVHGQVLKMSGEFQAYTLVEPIGVVGHIVPWNFPLSLLFYKVAPSLAAGCTMVVKPSEQTSLSALFVAHLAKQVRACLYFYI